MAKDAGYKKHAKLIHWGMAFIIVLVWIIGFYTAHFRGNAPRGGIFLEFHKGIASLVLFMTMWRLLYRVSHDYPHFHSDGSRMAHMIIKVGHVLLYLIVMIAVPLSGWYWSSVAGSPPLLLGIIPLPAIAAVDHSHYIFGMWLHRLLAWFAGLLVLGHAMAALKHHFYDKDDTLKRMWNFSKKSQ
ncbi:cytochrome b [Rouxiella sp. Mn2063]|uniref:cytochrome b n=1 Tax=Rouxiella sp. Mn2063 TaxID=3395262 RepID=UPI003BD8AE1A